VANTKVSPERLALCEQLLDEGWPFQEITRTHGVSYGSLRKYFPGRQWTNAEAGELGRLARKLKINEPAPEPTGKMVHIMKERP